MKVKRKKSVLVLSILLFFMTFFSLGNFIIMENNKVERESLIKDLNQTIDLLEEEKRQFVNQTNMMEDRIFALESKTTILMGQLRKARSMTEKFKNEETEQLREVINLINSFLRKKIKSNTDLKEQLMLLNETIYGIEMILEDTSTMQNKVGVIDPAD